MRSWNKLIQPKQALNLKSESVKKYANMLLLTSNWEDKSALMQYSLRQHMQTETSKSKTYNSNTNNKT